MKKTGKGKQAKKSKLAVIGVSGLVTVIAIVGILFIVSQKPGNSKVSNVPASTASSNAASKPAASADVGKLAQGEDIIIKKSEITETAAFIPYQAGKIKMEVIAVKAPDGTIRTALNTCQVCYDSGRGYYVQEGDELVCQNCGNRFNISKVEKIKNGCNPVPVLVGDKTDNGDTITIAGEFLAQNVYLFKNWK